MNFTPLKSLIAGLAIAAFSGASQAAPDFSGTWENGRGGPRPAPSAASPADPADSLYTAEGQRLVDDYDLLVDDPGLQCIPASWPRLYVNPNSKFRISFLEEGVYMEYSFMDVRRWVPFGTVDEITGMPSSRNVKGDPYQTLGSSIARIDGDRLIIESTHFAAGRLTTGGGMPQSEASSAVEEYWREGDTLRLRITHTDPEMFVRPVERNFTFRPSETDAVGIYDCQAAGYDWFEQLNQGVTP